MFSKVSKLAEKQIIKSLLRLRRCYHTWQPGPWMQLDWGEGKDSPHLVVRWNMLEASGTQKRGLLENPSILVR